LRKDWLTVGDTIRLVTSRPIRVTQPAARRGRAQEFKSMVRTLHAEGFEVILDVVYNHTAEADHRGPTLSMRGIDNVAYYRLAEDRSRYIDFTGCRNSLNVDNPHVLQLMCCVPTFLQVHK
jgi:isoamylase